MSENAPGATRLDGGTRGELRLHDVDAAVALDQLVAETVEGITEHESHIAK
ncbi:hypothetical protein [Nocardia amikacinitolerans]|uniref:hypothetical protein n=1 Tax=Nocardia amikacinitolerans TaxID=756689 RepID=UPI0012ED48F0|nr:hypothetical protein [Nocardia amikacinitolerans]